MEEGKREGIVDRWWRAAGRVHRGLGGWGIVEGRWLQGRGIAGGWEVENGGWKVVDVRWRLEGGGCNVEGERQRVEG